MLELKCANCGVTLKITEWGPNRICPICGEHTVKVDIQEVHVFFSDLHLQSFDRFINDEEVSAVLQRKRDGKDFHSGIDYLFMHLYYELCIGNISNPPYSNANYYAHHYSSCKSALLRSERASKKLDSVDSTVPIYLWLSDNDVNEFMNLLYFAKLFNRFENVFLVKWIHTEKDFPGSKLTMVKALTEKTKLTAKDLDDLSDKFTKIQGWNAECLVGNSELVEPWSFSRIEEYVLGCMSEKYRGLGNIYSDVLKAIKKDTSYRICYNTVTEAVHRLMMVGKIKSRGACMWWGSSDNNNLLCTQFFCIANRQPRQYSYEDALDIVCDAFEFGYTYPLYDLLNDSSILLKEEHSITGKWDIIEYIESIGSHRINYCHQNVECDITKVEEGKDYQKDDIYILLVYLEYEEEKKLHDSWLLKIYFDDNIIHKIEFSKPKGGLRLTAVD